MEENTEKKGCTGHCEDCNINQRTYCAAQMAYYNQEEISQIKAVLADMNKGCEESIILRDKTAKKPQIEPYSVIPPDADELGE